MIGKCNLTAFSGGGMKCQRDMIMALKDNANCRSVSYLLTTSKTISPLIKAWFKRRILHAPNQILILVDSNEYVRLI